MVCGLGRGCNVENDNQNTTREKGKVFHAAMVPLLVKWVVRNPCEICKKNVWLSHNFQEKPDSLAGVIDFKLYEGLELVVGNTGEAEHSSSVDEYGWRLVDI